MPPSNQSLKSSASTKGAVPVLFDVVGTETLPESIARRIREAILAGKLPPGSRIREITVSEQMGVSRGPVREAFRMLEEQGLITSSRYRGSRVATLSATEAEEIYTLRAQLEAYALELAAKRFTDAHIAGKQAAVDGMRAGAARQDYLVASKSDLKFHSVIWEASGHGLLRSILHNLRTKIELLLAYDHRLVENRAQVLQDHQIIIDQLGAGNVTQAVELLRGNILKAGTLIVARLRGTEVVSESPSQPSAR